ncbi:hypothetical protein [Streptomyces sp. SID12488]|uniref:hypothetical protein n=1 Tax=Streptomyces sp. SID12488 TaxID=2706040 RepID=UPI0013DA0EE9|nr:hypothetical protein [Streptomyces sp. SID12488]
MANAGTPGTPGPAVVPYRRIGREPSDSGFRIPGMPAAAVPQRILQLRIGATGREIRL